MCGGFAPGRPSEGGTGSSARPAPCGRARPGRAGGSGRFPRAKRRRLPDRPGHLGRSDALGALPGKAGGGSEGRTTARRPLRRDVHPGPSRAGDCASAPAASPHERRAPDGRPSTGRGGEASGLRTSPPAPRRGSAGAPLAERRAPTRRPGSGGRALPRRRCPPTPSPVPTATPEAGAVPRRRPRPCRFHPFPSPDGTA